MSLRVSVGSQPSLFLTVSWFLWLFRASFHASCVWVCVCVCVSVWVCECFDTSHWTGWSIMQIPSCLTPSVIVVLHRSNPLCKIAGRMLLILFLQFCFPVYVYIYILYIYIWCVCVCVCIYNMNYKWYHSISIFSRTLGLIYGDPIDHENVCAASSIASTYMYIHTFIQLYNALQCIYCVYVLCMYRRKKRLYQHLKTKPFICIMHCSTVHSFIGCHPLALLTVQKLNEYQNRNK